MSELHAPPEKTWRPLNDSERALVELWLAKWSESTGNNARMTDSLTARTSCTCGSCDTFDVRDLDLGSAPRGIQRLDGMGFGLDASGEWVANLTVIKSDDSVSFEVYPTADVEISLPLLTWDLRGEHQSP